ncbi:hypothetical protein GCM10009574_047330 [Streptomyces asiaticus]|uniref:Uncharacterized protein n=2 Tax=Streptomyces rhizosphaericus TaxID=114699 RepID=A0ABN1PBQ3_9ACTN
MSTKPPQEAATAARLKSCWGGGGEGVLVGCSEESTRGSVTANIRTVKALLSDGSGRVVCHVASSRSPSRSNGEEASADRPGFHRPVRM